MTSVTHNNGEPITAEEQPLVDRFVASFILKKGSPPAGHWRVPGVGYCVFLLK